ncbi:MAG: hypothetical protein QM726_01105 [Chitinophagaceae bacterium]
MATTTYQNLTGIHKPSLFSQFINWCNGQEERRFMWLGLALAGHGCLLTPLTVMAIIMSGNSLPLFMLAIGAMAIALVVNLAAQPTKISIPILLLTVLIDLGIIISCAISGFHTGNTF